MPGRAWTRSGHPGSSSNRALPRTVMRGHARTRSGYPRIPSNRVFPRTIMRGLDPRIHVRRHDGSTWMPRTSRGMTTRGGGQAERTPRQESGIPRLINIMRDSPGLGGIRRDKVGSSETSGIPQQRLLPESRPSARPTFPSSRTQRAWTLRRAPQHPAHAMPPSRPARTCPDMPGLDPGIRVSAHPYGNPTGYDPFARPPHAAILSRPARDRHRTMVRRVGREQHTRQPTRRWSREAPGRRPGRRDCAARVRAQPSERSERPAIEGNEQVGRGTGRGGLRY